MKKYKKPVAKILFLNDDVILGSLTGVDMKDLFGVGTGTLDGGDLQ